MVRLTAVAACVAALVTAAAVPATREASFKDGTPKMRMELNEEGKANGAYISYHRNGVVRTRGQFENGKRVGLWIHADERGYICGYEEIARVGEVHAIRTR